MEITLNSGIYQITNTINNKIYVGSAINFINRERIHFSKLKHNKHENQHLQHSYNKYGKDNFEFTELINYSIDELIMAEQIFINVFKPEYNMRKIAKSSLGIKRSEETKRKLSKSKLGNTNWLGKKQSKEHIEKKTKARQIPIVQLNKDGTLIREFDSVTLASKVLKTYPGQLTSCCKYEAGLNKINNKTTKGFRFMYKDQYKLNGNV